MRRRIVQVAVLAAILALSFWLLLPDRKSPRGANAGEGGDPAAMGEEGGAPRVAADPAAPAPAGLATVDDSVPRPPVGTSSASSAAAPPLPDEPTSGPFRGIVIDEEGRPVARAIVRVASGWGKAGGIDPRGFPVVTTAANGRFSFDAADDVRALRVHATADGRAPLRPDAEARRSEGAVVVLVAACALRVQVLDAKSREAVPGVRLVAYPGGRDAEATNDIRERLSSDSATTDATGRATLRVKSGTWDVLAIPPDHARTLRRGLLVPADGLDAVFEVAVGRMLSGQVVDPAANLVAGAKVHGWAALGWEADTVTGPAGEFSFVHVPPEQAAESWRDQTRFEATADGFAPGKWPAGAYLIRSGSIEPEIRIALRRRATLVGVVQRERGDPAVGATVRVEGIEAPATTDSSGGFRVEGAAVDAWIEAALVTAAGEERGAARADPERASVTIALGSPSTPRTAERDGPRFSRVVRVLDWYGKPVAGALVGAGRLVARYDVFDSGRTGADGAVRLEDLPAGRVLVVVHPPSGPAFDAVVDVAAPDGPETVLTIPGGVVAGRVLTLDGAPARIEVILVRTLETPEGSPGAFLGSHPVRTAEDGAFRFTGVGDGTYALQTPRGTDRLIGGPPRIRAGDEGITAWIASLSEETALLLEAELLEADDGKPIDVGSVSATLAAGDDSRTLDLRPVPGASGLFRSLAAAPPGTYDVTIAARGRRPALARGVRFPQGTRPPRVALRLERGGRITGRVLDSAERPVPGAVVRTADREDVVGPDGEYDLAVAGDVEVHVSGDLILDQSQHVPFRADEVVRIDLHVKPAGAILLRLPDARLPKTSVRVAAHGENRILFTEIDAAWLRSRPPARTIPSLAPGRWRLSITWDDVPLPPREVDVTAGVTTAIDVSPP